MNRNTPELTRGRKMLIALRQMAASVDLKASTVRPHRLLLYVKLSAGTNAIEFAVDRRNGEEHPLEIRLDENDTFVCHAMGLALHKVMIKNGVEMPALNARVFYPDLTMFPGPVVVDATEQESLEMVYNGLIQFETEQDIRVKDLDTSMFRTVHQTQSSGTTLPQLNGEEIKDLHTGITFWGGSRNDITIKMNSAAGDYKAIEGVADDHVNYAVLILEGNIMTGGAKKATAGRLQQLLLGQ